MKQITSTLILLIAVLIAGCSGSNPGSEASLRQNLGQDASTEPAFAQDSNIDSIEHIVNQSEPSADSSTNATSRLPATRKIIYNCRIGLVVEDYKIFESRLPQMVANYGGFVASNDTDRRYQDRQSGTWVVRIPVSQYSDFLNGVDSFGFAESRTENAQDVTEEYVDVEARIKTKRQLETRILKLLEERTGKMADVLEIERELSRVREEVERMEGRIRFLKDRTSLATVTISCREEQQYTPAAAPTFASRISRSWFDSLSSMQQLGENALVALIAAAPWLFVISTVAFIAYFARKRLWSQRHAA